MRPEPISCAPAAAKEHSNFLPAESTKVMPDKSTFMSFLEMPADACQQRASSSTHGPESLPSSFRTIPSSMALVVIRSIKVESLREVGLSATGAPKSYLDDWRLMMLQIL